MKQSITAGGMPSTMPIGSAGLPASAAVWRIGASFSVREQDDRMDQPDRAEDQEGRVPAEPIGDVAGRDRAQPGAGEHRGLVDRQRAAAHRGPVPVADQRGRGRIISGFADRDEPAHRQQQREAAGERRRAGRDAPEDQPERGSAGVRRTLSPIRPAMKAPTA